MHRGAMLLPAVAVLVALVPMRAMAASSADALVGSITSDAEGRMEGVLVIAKREGSAVLTAVVTDAQGQYRFPRTHLAPGNYNIRIRAAGYVMPNGSESVTVDGDRVGQLSLRVRQSTTDELAHQSTFVSW